NLLLLTAQPGDPRGAGSAPPTRRPARHRGDAPAGATRGEHALGALPRARHGRELGPSPRPPARAPRAHAAAGRGLAVARGRTGAGAPVRLDRPFPDPLLRRLFPPLATGVHWGLERTEAALRALGDAHRRYASVHVGGTNGKGSVTSTVASVLRAA